MRLKKFIKKAFTLVELVVVIAVVAILASVSVGLYFGITTTANKSVDEQIVTQYNKILQLYEIQDKVADNTATVRVYIRENGIVNFTPFYAKNEYYWVKDLNRVIIWEEGEGVTFPTQYAKSEEFKDLTTPKSTTENWFVLDATCFHKDAQKLFCKNTCGIGDGDTCKKDKHYDNDYYYCADCGKTSDLPLARVEFNEDAPELVPGSQPICTESEALVFEGASSFPGNLETLDCKYTFKTALDETTKGNVYNYWSADFIVSFAKEGVVDTEVGVSSTFGLWGKYNLTGEDLNLMIPATSGITPKMRIPLLSIGIAAYKDNPIDLESLANGTFEGIGLQYQFIVDFVKEFECGVWEDGSNAGLVITVQLCMWQTSENPIYTFARPHVVGEWTHTFTGNDNIAE